MVVYSNAPWARFTERRSHRGTTVSRTDPPRQVKSPNRPWHLHRKTLKPQTPNNSVPHLNVPINCRRTSDTTWDRTLTTALVAGSTIRDIGAQVLQQEAVMAHGRHEGPQSQLRSWQQLEQLPQTHCTPHKCRGHSWAERAQVQTIYCGIAWTSESKCKIYISKHCVCLRRFEKISDRADVLENDHIMIPGKRVNENQQAPSETMLLMSISELISSLFV